MRCLVQRVTSADVKVDGHIVGKIGPGLAVLSCAMRDDEDKDVPLLARKLVNLRIFRDDAGKMNRSILDCGGSALIISQFTLAADTSRGNRPGFSQAARADLGKARFTEFVEAVRQYGVQVATGVFGEEMQVSLTNDGPVTIWLDTANYKRKQS